MLHDVVLRDVVLRDAQGHWHVAGLDLAADDTGVEGSAAADWSFDQPEIVIRAGLLRWNG